MASRSLLGLGLGFVTVLALAGAPARGQDGQLDMAIRTRTHDAVGEALRYLVAGQREDGGWVAFDGSHPAITALVVKAIVQDDRYGPKHAAARRGLAFVMRFVQPDGGIYVPGEGMRNYHTSVALMALAATKDPAYAKPIRDAQNFLKKIQWDAGEGHEASSTFFGGQGYGQHKRPDLSNTQLMLEALHQSGLSPDDPVYKKALVFVSRCQMLDTSNDQPFADGSSDGGFIYTPVNEGESKAGTDVAAAKPRLRSYGSMTYAGFKSLLYAKVDRNDQRVKRAIDWIQRHYTLDHNPNMPTAQSKEGLYYYYHVFARAMSAWGEDRLADGDGVPHAWRVELCERLLSLQNKDGSWVNQQDRWYEGNPHLVTAYAVLALQTALAK